MSSQVHSDGTGNALLKKRRYADVGQHTTLLTNTPSSATNNCLQVGINLGDAIFRGIYHGKQAHEDDLEGVLQRAVDAGCVKLMVTGSDLEESKKAVKMAEEHRR